MQAAWLESTLEGMSAWPGPGTASLKCGCVRAGVRGEA